MQAGKFILIQGSWRLYVPHLSFTSCAKVGDAEPNSTHQEFWAPFSFPSLCCSLETLSRQRTGALMGQEELCTCYSPRETQCLAPVTASERHSAHTCYSLGETQCLAPVTASERHSAHTCYNLRETQCSHLLQPRRDTVPHTCLGQVVHFEKYLEAPSGLPLRAPWCRIL